MPVSNRYWSLKSGRSFGEQIKLNAVVPRVCTDLTRINYLRRWDQSLHLVAHIADLVILGIATNVDRLVVNALLRSFGKCCEGASNITAVNQRTPRRSVGLNANFTIRHCRTKQVVDNQSRYEALANGRKRWRSANKQA